MNDTNEVPKIAVVLNNLGRVSLIFLLLSWTDICRAKKASTWQAQKASEGHRQPTGIALGLKILSYSGSVPSVVRPREGHVPRDMFPPRFSQERNRVDGSAHSHARRLLTLSVPCEDSAPRRGFGEH